MKKNFTGDNIFELHKAIKTQIETEFSSIGIGYGQVNILMRLFANEEAVLKQSEMPISLGIDKSNASRNILKLKQKGYLNVFPLNKRDNGIQLTAKGKSMKPIITQVLNSISNRMTNGIPDNDITLTNQILVKMKGNLE